MFHLPRATGRVGLTVSRIGLAVGLAGAAFAAAAIPGTAQAGPAVAARLTNIPAATAVPALPTIAVLLAPYAGAFDRDNNNFNIASHLVLQFPDIVAAATKPGSSTVFLPTDYAFRRLIQVLTGFTVVPEADLLKAVQRLGAATVGAIVRFHILDGTRFTYAMAAQANGLQFRTLQGGTVRVGVDRIPQLTVHLRDKAPRLADAKIVRANWQASNGLIHVIDRVMMPMAA